MLFSKTNSAGTGMRMHQRDSAGDQQVSTISRWTRAASTAQPRILQRGVTSLANSGIVMIGQEHRVLTCLEEHVTDALGGLLGTMLYPLDEGMHGREVDIDSAAQIYEARAGLKFPRDKVLVLRKLPRARISTPDPWIASEEFAMAALIDDWGRVEPDHYVGMYHVEYFDFPAPGVDRIPDVDAMIELRLGRYIIDCYEHPGLDILRDPPTEEEYLAASFSHDSANCAAGG